MILPFEIHYIYALSGIRYWSRQAQLDEVRRLQHILKAGDKACVAIERRKAAELTRVEKRKAEPDRLKVELAKKQQTAVDTEKRIALAWVLLTLAQSLV